MAEIHPQTGPKILYYRKLRNWSLRELEKRSGVSYSLIASYERREVAPQYDKIALIAAALGVTTTNLWDMEPPPESEPRTQRAKRRPKPRGKLEIVR